MKFSRHYISVYYFLPKSEKYYFKKKDLYSYID